ncbi:MinD/ParA family protein OS=Streptomyces cyaneofuscatus OX=66883 GN=G3I52_23735 PE=4 SV=1 [Streptomyces cyaneofuscatus]
MTTPDVVAVRGAKRAYGCGTGSRSARPEETVTLVNRYTRYTEIQPTLIQKITGTRVASTVVPANFKETPGRS